jgi:hypothetical protein
MGEKTRGRWTATDEDSIIVKKDPNRVRLTVQLITPGAVVALGFGEKAKFDEGIRLHDNGLIYRYSGELVTNAVHAICDTGQTAEGGYQVG